MQVGSKWLSVYLAYDCTQNSRHSTSLAICSVVLSEGGVALWDVFTTIKWAGEF